MYLQIQTVRLVQNKFDVCTVHRSCCLTVQSYENIKHSIKVAAEQELLCTVH